MSTEVGERRATAHEIAVKAGAGNWNIRISIRADDGPGRWSISVHRRLELDDARIQRITGNAPNRLITIKGNIERAQEIGVVYAEALAAYFDAGAAMEDANDAREAAAEQIRTVIVEHEDRR